MGPKMDEEIQNAKKEGRLSECKRTYGRNIFPGWVYIGRTNVGDPIDKIKKNWKPSDGDT